MSPRSRLENGLRSLAAQRVPGAPDQPAIQRDCQALLSAVGAGTVDDDFAALERLVRQDARRVACAPAAASAPSTQQEVGRSLEATLSSFLDVMLADRAPPGSAGQHGEPARCSVHAAVTALVQHYCGPAAAAAPAARLAAAASAAAAAAAAAAAPIMPDEVLECLELYVRRLDSAITALEDPQQQVHACRQLLQLSQAAVRAGEWRLADAACYPCTACLHRGADSPGGAEQLLPLELLTAGGVQSMLSLICSVLVLSLRAAAAGELGAQQAARLCRAYATLLLRAGEQRPAAAAQHMQQAGVAAELLQQLQALEACGAAGSAELPLHLQAALPQLQYLLSAQVHQQPGALDMLRRLVEVSASGFALASAASLALLRLPHRPGRQLAGHPCSSPDVRVGGQLRR